MGYRSNHDLQDLFASGPLEASARRMAERCVGLLREEVVKRTPVAKVPPGQSLSQFAGSRGRMPGALKASWYETPVAEEVRPAGTPVFAGDVATDDDVAPFVEYDTRPHVIRPRPDRGAASVLATGKPRRMGTDPMARLRWVGPDGRVHYAAEVHHPGTRGVHMMRDALLEVDATWDERVGAPELERWAKEQLAGVNRWTLR